MNIMIKPDLHMFHPTCFFFCGCSNSVQSLIVHWFSAERVKRRFLGQKVRWMKKRAK